MNKWMLIGMVFLGAAVLEGSARDRMSIQVREGQLREQPSFLGRVVAGVEYGDRVTVQETRGPWKRVEAREAEGWIHESALTRKRIVLEAGDEDVGPAAARDEIALAGRGFTEDVEREYRNQHQELNFSRVDRMEREGGLMVEEIVRFLREGGLEGGAE